jgi:nucleoside-diphosphate-sugar epimerase
VTSGINLVTGATGFLGSHLAERLVRDGQRVRALARPSSDTTFLDHLGVEKVTGDLTDPPSVERACRDVEVIYHAAAKVADWGPWREFEKHIVEATNNLARAAQRASVRRFVHISSVSAYADSGKKDLVVDETSPLGGHTHRWDHYAHAKAQAERDLWELYEREGLPLTIIRPAWIYGPRDRAFIARFHRLLTSGRICILGNGRNLLSTVFVGNVAEACLLAAASERAVGQAYNCSSDGPITQREFLRLWADAFGCPCPTRWVPYPLAHFAGLLCECVGHLLHWQAPPGITRHSVAMLGRRPYFPTEKARHDLGWQPTVSYREGIDLAVRWYLEQLGVT